MKMNRQQGFTLLEILVVLAIGTLLLGAMGAAMQTYGDNVANRAVADQQLKIRDAALKYIEDNAGTIIAAAGPSTPYTISVGDLRTGGYLPNSFTGANAYALTTTIKVIEPSAGKLEGYMLASPPASAPKVSGQNLRKIAQLIGADGGFAEGTGAGVNALGAYGGWWASMTPVGGTTASSTVVTSLAVAEAAGTVAAGDPLSRTPVAGQPELNRMSTHIDMNGNNINGAGYINGTLVNSKGYLTLKTYDVGSYGAGGALLWYNANANTVSMWKEGGGASHLQAGNITSELNLQVNGSAQVNGSINANANVSAWDVNARGGVNSSNHVNATTSMSAGTQISTKEYYASGWFRSQNDSGWYNGKWGGGIYMVDGTWIRTYGGKSFYSDQEIRANRMSTEGRMSAGEYLDVNGWGSRGGGCGKHGLIAQDGNGLLFCRGGVWIGTGSPTGGSYQHLGTFGGTYVGYNTSSYNSMVVIQAMANGCSRNGYSVVLYVNGGFIGSMNENHPDYAKVGHTSFMVPAGGNFQITPQWTGSCNTKFDVFQYYQS